MPYMCNTKISFALIQQFAYMPICLYAYMLIFHNPKCLYADSIRYCLCEIDSCIYLVYNCSHMVQCLCAIHSVQSLLYMQLQAYSALVTHIFRLYLCNLTIMYLQSLKILCKLYRQCIGNAVAFTDALSISSIQEPIQILILVQAQL